MANDLKKNSKKKEKKVVEAEVISESKEKTSDNKSKFTFAMSEVILIMIITLLFGLFIGSFLVYKNYNNDNIVCNEIDSNVNGITSVYNELLSDYYGEVDKEKVMDDAIKGMIDGLGDPYASYISSRDAVEFNEELEGYYIGLGIQITNDENNIKVINVYDDSPASKSGIKTGDIIVSIDSLKVNFDNVDELLDIIKKSKNGEKKVINVLREGKNIRFNVKLDVIDIKSVYSNIILNEEKKIGIIKITNFSNNTYNQFALEYESMKDEIDGLIIDLRDNGGGYINSAYSIASLFLDKDDVVYQKTDGVDIDRIVNDKEKSIDIPLVILVNGYTASSSEILAISLKENIEVTLIGTKTYGKGTIQKVHSLGNDKYIKFTTQEWLSPNGNTIDGIGIVPDIIIPVDNKLNTDVQLDKSLEVIMNKIGG